MTTLKETVSQLGDLQAELKARHESELTAQRQAFEFISEKNQDAWHLEGFITGLVGGLAIAATIAIVIYTFH